MRLFVGIALPEKARQTLDLLEHGVPGARWVAAEYLHLTLAFLGDLAEHEARELDAELATIRAPGFMLNLGGLGLFGEKRKPRILYLDADPCPPLARLAGKVTKAVERAGLEPERRKFKGHVTLARLKNPSPPHLDGFLERNKDIRLDPIPVDQFILYRSHLGQTGAHYEELVHYPLEGLEGE